jgi:hypothetical protein
MIKPITIVLVTLALRGAAQEDLLSMVGENKEQGPERVSATFKTVRIGNAQSVETVKKNHLDFRISHRFANIYDADQKNALNEAARGFFGFDAASDIRFSLDYGITDALQVGIGRSQLNHLLDGSIKWKLLKQTTDFKMPVTVVFYSSTAYRFDPLSAIYGDVVSDFAKTELHRFSFFNQLIIGSKINSWLSLELLPGYFHRNYIVRKVNAANGAEDQNGFFNLGFGGRLKFTKRLSLIGDYFYNFSEYYSGNTAVKNPLALGFELETGGHVFSLFFTNASGLIENNFIVGNGHSWTKGQVKFGFCISRTFPL